MGVDWPLVLLFVACAAFVAGIVVVWLMLLELLDEAKPTWPVVSRWMWGDD